MITKKNSRIILFCTSSLFVIGLIFFSLQVYAAGINATIKIGVCGDGIIDTNEQCDGGDLNNKSCTLLGYTGGTLSCSLSCDFDVSSCNGASPAQVVIQSISSVVVPNIVANVRITNEGITNTEYTYEWCIVSNISNSCGGGDDTYYASASKLIVAGENFDTSLTATVPLPDTYYFKTNVFYGILSSGASQQFTATNPTSSGGGGGGGISLTNPSINPTTNTIVADLNNDGKISGIDLSILLAFWKTEHSFKNFKADINNDNQVDGVDLSILLYWWDK